MYDYFIDEEFDEDDIQEIEDFELSIEADDRADQIFIEESLTAEVQKINISNSKIRLVAQKKI